MLIEVRYAVTTWSLKVYSTSSFKKYELSRGRPPLGGLINRSHAASPSKTNVNNKDCWQGYTIWLNIVF